jgi:hypothetical protein
MKKLLLLLPDVLILLGFLAIVYGIWQIHPPSAWIVAGISLIGYSVLMGYAEKRAKLMLKFGVRE